MKAKPVIRIGRRRDQAAWTAAIKRFILMSSACQTGRRQDRILVRWRDQHDQADLHQDIVHAAQVDADYRARTHIGTIRITA